ncbi:unnamed protein product [Parnassius apollo]|uniref:(apollo) hypothetical protein n=1 Tax=Parnassius apollo TaxID=110799 RepID=A0A8S3XDY6_PARAO|nr:unnamed protein product [Parnassius apollo]
MSFPRSRIINDRDIEEYLSALEGGYLSEDGMEMSDTEDNEESIFYTNRNEPLQDVEDDDNLENEPTLHKEQVDVHDPPLILETVASKTGENSACSTWVLDKRKLIWKKSTLQFSESNIEFEGSTDLGTKITALKTPYQCFNYFFTPELCNKIISETNLYANQLNPENRFNLSHYDLKKFLGILLYISVQHFPSTRKYWSRIPNNKLPDKKEMMKKNTPRGTYEERTASYDGIDLACIAWKDNKIVTMLSSYVGAEPVSTVKRFDKKTRERVDILCPKSITEYNSHMGGVDLLDSFLGRYHIRVKSRKWYIRIFFHLFDLAVINSWIIYKNNAKKENVAKKNILNLGEFRNELAYVLCNSGTNENKRGRPSSSSLEQELQAKKKRLQSKPIPPLDIRMDGLGHWPDVGVSLRCKYPHCTGYTTISCAKCGINLCLNKNNNCFTKFHTT